MFCSSCGKELPEESKFCSICGATVFGTVDSNADIRSNISKRDKQDDEYESDVGETTETTKIKPLDWALLVLAILYMVSPVDLVPDVIPVAGWFDDLTAIFTTGLNVVQKGFADSVTWLSTIAKMLKWTILILGVILVVIIILLGTVIIKLFQG